MGRLRTIVKAKDDIKESKFYLFPDKFEFVFKKHVYLEIGCGKGDFLISQAIKNPDINYIGFEKYATVLYKAINKLNLILPVVNNIWFINDDALQLQSFFSNYKFNKIFLNFCDPWPKKRHIKKRLTNPDFITIYSKLLMPKALIEFKTDNDNLYKYSLKSFASQKQGDIIYFTEDLYAQLNNKFNVDNIQSEYEKKFCVVTNINKIIWKLK